MDNKGFIKNILENQIRQNKIQGVNIKQGREE